MDETLSRVDAAEVERLIGWPETTNGALDRDVKKFETEVDLALGRSKEKLSDTLILWAVAIHKTVARLELSTLSPKSKKLINESPCKN